MTWYYTTVSQHGHTAMVSCDIRSSPGPLHHQMRVEVRLMLVRVRGGGRWWSSAVF